MTRDLSDFRRQLLDWYHRVRRDLPWRRSRDPYAIWISEIMLQQTRVAAVIPFYERFLERFPNPVALAEASESDVLALWAGLGYYSRARNLQKAAREMPGGEFPRTYSEVRKLAGIGDYTAAAITSIAFDQPYAAVDGNVLRVYARLENDPSDIGSAVARKRIGQHAQAALDPRSPGDWNQAVMELGATVCTPKSPQCGQCPVHQFCGARAAGTQAELPVRIRPDKRVEIERTLLLIRRELDGALLLTQRGPENGQLAGFWELPSMEQLPEAVITDRGGGHSFTHQITHHRYEYQVVRASWDSVQPLPNGFQWLRQDEMQSLPVTTASRKALSISLFS